MDMFELALFAVGAVFALSIVAGLFPPRPKPDDPQEGLLSGYLLANRRLSRWPLVSLLLSTSFGLNTMFYQGWLGYTVGIWGIVIQTAWAASFFWLAKYSAGVRDSKSLHDFLSSRYGPHARAAGAVCSIVGFVFLMGWEVDICRQMFAGFLSNGNAHRLPSVIEAAGWLAAATAIGALVYTLFGGLRGNAMADILQNSIKLVALCVLIFFLFNIQSLPPVEALVWNKMTLNLGVIGLITNMIFSICWQFVDASTWQSVEASAARQSPEQTVNDLRISGIVALIIPGFLGTFVGIALSGIPGITQEGFFYSIIQHAGGGTFVLFLFLFSSAAAVMSLVDGLLLASAYALVIDLAKPNSTLAELDKNEDAAAKLITIIRFSLILLTIVAAWGLRAIVTGFGLTTFDTVYLVIIPQLGLFGPIFFGLRRTGQAPSASRSKRVALIILGSVAIGLWATLFGSAVASGISDFAGTITVVVSCILMLIFVRSNAASQGATP